MVGVLGYCIDFHCEDRFNHLSSDRRLHLRSALPEWLLPPGSADTFFIWRYVLIYFSYHGGTAGVVLVANRQITKL